jgi:hypothetical protein
VFGLLLYFVTDCLRLSFAEAMAAVPPRSRLAARLCAEVVEAIAGSSRAVVEVAAAVGVAWHGAHGASRGRRVVVAGAAVDRGAGSRWTRARRVWWLLESAGWRRLNHSAMPRPLTQPLPKHLKELGSSSLIKPKDAGTINMRIQHDLTIDLCHPEIAEPSTAMNLTGDGNGPVVGTHDNLVL